MEGMRWGVGEIDEFDDAPESDGAVIALLAILAGLVMAVVFLTSCPVPEKLIEASSSSSNVPEVTDRKLPDENKIRFATVDDIRRHHEEQGIAEKPAP